MGFFDELKKLTRPYDDEDEFFSDGEIPAQSVESAQESRGSFFDEPADEPAYAPAPVQRVTHPAPSKRASKANSRVVNIGSDKQQVVLVKPDRFDSAGEIADHLKAGHTVVLSLEAADKTTARRLVDFLSGAAYVQEGNLKRVSSDTFLITPNGVPLTGDLTGEIESGTLSF